MNKTKSSKLTYFLGGLASAALIVVIVISSQGTGRLFQGALTESDLTNISRTEDPNTLTEEKALSELELRLKAIENDIEETKYLQEQLIRSFLGISLDYCATNGVTSYNNCMLKIEDEIKAYIFK